ncbi:MAG: hypothetical protein JRH20_30435 [Deltaproteobacteria bacterium]|nr:hypothetical protein [Deltaproteobacteria bacterium]
MTDKDPASAPAGVTTEEKAAPLRLRFQDRSRGLTFLGLPIMLFVTVTAFSIKNGGSSATEVMIASAIIGFLTIIAVAMILKFIVLSFEERVLVITTRPFFFLREERLPLDQIAELKIVTKYKGSSSSGGTAHYALHAVNKSNEMIKLTDFDRNKDDAELVERLLRRRLREPSSKSDSKEQ